MPLQISMKRCKPRSTSRRNSPGRAPAAMPMTELSDRQHQAEQDRDAEAVDRSAPARRAPGRRCRASSGASAARARAAQVLHDRVVAVGDGRPDDPALLLDQLPDRRVACSRPRSSKKPPKWSRVGDEDREHRAGPRSDTSSGRSLAISSAKRRDDEQDDEQERRPVAAAVGPEVGDPAQAPSGDSLRPRSPGRVARRRRPAPSPSRRPALEVDPGIDQDVGRGPRSASRPGRAA